MKFLLPGLLWCAAATGCGTPATEPAAAEQTNTVVETIMSRRSIRKYHEQPVEREKMALIIDCGLNAPSGLNRQPWAVRVVDSEEFLGGVSARFLESAPEAAQEPGFRNIFRNAPTVAFIASPEDGSGDLDCGLLGENMILAAWSMGIGSCCLGGPTAFMRSPEAADYLSRLDLPEGYVLRYAIGFGYPDETPEARPRDLTKARYVE